jgi:outer membrane receptor for ferrienterochelin and colicin
MKQWSLFLILGLTISASHAQSTLTSPEPKTVKGQVYDMSNAELLVGANVVLIGTQQGTTTNDRGRFELEIESDEVELIISMVGYQSDTFRVSAGSNLNMMLRPGANLDEVVVEGQEQSASLIQGINQVTLSRDELDRAACCNLSESFETSLDVDVESSDAVTGTKMIRMLGLDGRYVQISEEYNNGISGIGLPYGLGLVPGPWIESIQVSKGPGSVTTGHEALAGQINVEYQKPDRAEKLYLNGYANMAGQFEGNLYSSHQVSEGTSTALLAHGHWRQAGVDRNGDFFYDVPNSKMASVANRWKFNKPGTRVRGQFGFRYTQQDLDGGQLENLIERWFPMETRIKRAEFWSKTALLNDAGSDRDWSLAFMSKAIWHRNYSSFGQRFYEGEQAEVYLRFMSDIQINSENQLKLGASFRYDWSSELLSDYSPAWPVSLNNEEIIPGVYAEHTLELSNGFTAISGVRADYHNQFGTFLSPRLHLKHNPGDNTAIRISAGRGWRTVEAISENLSWLASNRDFAVDFGGSNTAVESGWNSGAGLVQQFKIAGREATLRFDYFYTYFTQRVIADVDESNAAVLVTSSTDPARSHAAQIDFGYFVHRNLEARFAYKYEDVRVSTAGELRRQILVPYWRGLSTLAYQSNDELWEADLTAQLVGPSRLPLQFELDESNRFVTLNAQVSRRIGKWLIYLGGENLTNYRQDNPIRNWEDPLSPDFDAALIWAPILGRNIYAGFKFYLD